MPFTSRWQNGEAPAEATTAFVDARLNRDMVKRTKAEAEPLREAEGGIMRKILFRMGTGCAAVASAAAAQPAQQPAPQPADQPGDIVVKAPSLKQQSKQFVNAVAAARTFDQLVLFDSPICPAAVGLSAPVLREIESRVRTVAKGAGLSVEQTCSPNFLIIIAPDKAEMVRGLRRKYPAYFTDLQEPEIAELASPRRSIAAWRVKGLLNPDGLPAEKNLNTGISYNESTGTASRIRKSSRPHSVSAVMVIDRDLLKGVSTRQLADYAVMRLLTTVDEKKLARLEADTILGLFGRGSRPASVTWWDFNFLKALYSTSNIHTAGAQRSEIARKLEKEMREIPPDPE